MVLIYSLSSLGSVLSIPNVLGQCIILTVLLALATHFLISTSAQHNQDEWKEAWHRCLGSMAQPTHY